MTNNLKLNKQRLIKTDGSYITLTTNLKKKNIGLLLPAETKLAWRKTTEVKLKQGGILDFFKQSV